MRRCGLDFTIEDEVDEADRLGNFFSGASNSRDREGPIRIKNRVRVKRARTWDGDKLT